MAVGNDEHFFFPFLMIHGYNTSLPTSIHPSIPCSSHFSFCRCRERHCHICKVICNSRITRRIKPSMNDQNVVQPSMDGQGLTSDVVEGPPALVLHHRWHPSTTTLADTHPSILGTPSRHLHL